MKIVKKKVQPKIVIFTAVKKSLHVAWACFNLHAVLVRPRLLSGHHLGKSCPIG